MTAEALAQHLAMEALLRDSSEKRTTTVMKRYFRLTLALAGLNVLVAGITMGALWSRPSRTPQGAPALPRSLPATSPAPATPPVLSPAPVDPVLPAVRPAAFPPQAPSPSLGSPSSRSSKREVLASAPRTRRPAAKPHVIEPRHADEDEAEGEPIVLSGATERW